MKPKILYVVGNWPAETGYGGQQRALNIGRLLKRFGDVLLVTACPGPGEANALRAIESEFEGWRWIKPELVVRRNPFMRCWNRLRRTVDVDFYTSRYWKISEKHRREFTELMGQFDVTWVHNINTVNSFELENWPNSVLDIDDIPSNFYRSRSESEKNPLKQWANRMMSKRWKNREGVLAERFDIITVCSERDKHYLGGSDRVCVVPNGFGKRYLTQRLHSDRLRIGFIGFFDYRPNHDGMSWFISEVWPLVKRELPDAHLRLVGRGSERSVPVLRADVTALGWVEDPSEEIASWSAMIVPIRFGGGTRIKIAEGFARKCPVISTTLGAYGYGVRDGEEILLADQASDFASACVRLMRDPALGDALAERAHQRYTQEFSWESSAPAVGTAVEACLSCGRARGGSTDSLSLAYSSESLNELPN